MPAEARPGGRRGREGAPRACGAPWLQGGREWWGGRGSGCGAPAVPRGSGGLDGCGDCAGRARAIGRGVRAAGSGRRSAAPRRTRRRGGGGGRAAAGLGAPRGAGRPALWRGPRRSPSSPPPASAVRPERSRGAAQPGEVKGGREAGAGCGHGPLARRGRRAPPRGRQKALLPAPSLPGSRGAFRGSSFSSSWPHNSPARRAGGASRGLRAGAGPSKALRAWGRAQQWATGEGSGRGCCDSGGGGGNERAGRRGPPQKGGRGPGGWSGHLGGAKD